MAYISFLNTKLFEKSSTKLYYTSTLKLNNWDTKRVAQKSWKRNYFEISRRLQ